MRKILWKTIKKNLTWMLLVSTLLLSILATITPRVLAGPTDVVVVPSLIELGPAPCVGEQFTVTVEIHEVLDLFGVDIQFGWDTEWIGYVSHAAKIPVETYPDGIMHEPPAGFWVRNDVDETASMPGAEPGTMYWLAYASMYPAAPFDGSGIAFEMTFVVKKQPDEALGEPDAVITLKITSSTLADSTGTAIEHERYDGTVIIPARAITTTNVEPSEITFGPETCVGEEFNVNVSLHDVADLYGLDVQFGWNTTYIEYVSHTAKIPVETYPDGIMHEPPAGIWVHDDVDETGGLVGQGAEPGTLYWLAYASLAPAPSFNGSGIIFEMTFKVKKQPQAILGEPDAVITLKITSSTLADSTGTAIEHERYDGTVIILAFVLPPVPLLKVTPEEVKEIPECNSFVSDVWLMDENQTDLDPFWDVGGFDITYNFDPTLIEAVSVTIDPDGWFASFWPSGILIVRNEIDNTAGTVWVAFLGIPGADGTHTEVYGEGRLFTVTFHVIFESETYPPPSCVLALNPTTIAGMPHPERKYPPWNGLESAVPLPHLVEDAVYKAPVYTAQPYIEVEVEVGFIYFSGEIAEFYILVKHLGNPINATEISASLYFNGSIYDDLTPLLEFVDTGLYRIPYDIPLAAQPGKYVLHVKAKYFNLHGTAIRGFQLSSTLTGWNALLISIDGTIATIKTDVGLIQVKLDDINATVVGIQGTLGIINSTVGTFEVKLDNINATLAGLIVNAKGEILAKIDTALGTITTDLANINATLVDVNGKVASINSTLGLIQTDISTINTRLVDIQGTLVTINSTVGTLTTNLANVNATISDLIVNSKGEVLARIEYYLGEQGVIEVKLDNINATLAGLIVNAKGEILAKIDTALGTITTKLDNINATVNEVNGNVITIDTTLGEVQDTAGAIQSTATIGLALACILSLIAAIAAIILIKKKPSVPT